MRISRIAAALAASALVAAGVAAIPAGATTSTITPTRPTSMVTSPYVLNVLLNHHVSLGTSGAVSVSVGGSSQNPATTAGAPVSIPTFSMAFASTRTGATSLSHTGTVWFRSGAHLVTAKNLVVYVNPKTKTGTVTAILNITGVRTTTFALRGIVLSHLTIGTHVWTVATAKVYIANSTVSNGLTAALGLSAPIFSLTTQIATATAYLY